MDEDDLMRKKKGGRKDMKCTTLFSAFHSPFVVPYLITI